MEDGAKKPKEPQVTRQLSVGLSLISRIEKLIAEVDTRLEKVLRDPGVEKGSPETKEPECLVPLAQSIQELNIHIEICASRLEGLLKRLEV